MSLIRLIPQMAYPTAPAERTSTGSRRSRRSPTSSTTYSRSLRIRRTRSPGRISPSTTRTSSTTPRKVSYWASKMSARSGSSGSPPGGGIRCTIASRISSIPSPFLAEISTTSKGSSPSSSSISSRTRSGSAAGRSILLITGTTDKSYSIATKWLATVCASTPCAASTSRRAPSQDMSERRTSWEKSTCPGVSIRLSWYHSPSLVSWRSETLFDLMVMPRSRSRSIESSN